MICVFHRSWVLACALLLSGCAARMAYKDGQELVNQGRLTEGLTKLEEASRLDPGVAQYRLTLIRTRERWLLAQLEQAESLRNRGRLDEAEQAYRQLMLAHGGNDRALAGLRAINQQRRAEAWLHEAQAAAEKKDAGAARTKLNAILLENPRHDAARRLMEQLDEPLPKLAPETILAAAYRKPITIEFKDAALKSVFEVISRTSGLNFIFDKDVRTDQKTSVFLKNSTIQAAVRLTLLTNQLEERVLDTNTVLIYPNTPAKQKEYQPLSVKSFYLANADAKIVAASLKALLKTRDLVVDEKLNMVILRDSPEAIKLAEKLVALHDLPEPEVMLEVEILEVKRTRLLDLGIRWPDQLSLSPLPAVGGGVLTLADLKNLNKSTVAASIGSVSINAKKGDTDANILANPRIRARNREKAKILIGERVPNITTTATSTGFVAESVNYVDVGLKLDVEPTIYLDGEVAIRISLEVSNIISQIQTKSGSIAYQIGTRTAQTVLRLKDGENQILAGLINDEDRRSGDRVPGLGDIPVAGRLFGQQTNDSTKTEIVLSITPRIVRNVRRPDAALLEFDSGTENSLGMRGASGTGQAAPAPPPIVPVPATPTPRSTTPAAGAASPTGTLRTDSSSAITSTSVSTATGAGATATAGVANVSWQGPTQLKTGDTFALQFMLQTDQPIVSIPFALGFDPAALQVVSVTEGDFMRQGAAHTAFASRVDPKGQIVGTVTRSGNAGAIGQGTVATVNFRVGAVAANHTQVQMITVAPVSLSGAQVPVGTIPAFSMQLVPGG